MPPSHDQSQPRHNLPSALSRFLGRGDEMRDIGQAITQHRLVTLTGVGGCGKTRLALQIATNALGNWPDGVWLAELASTARNEDVARDVARVFGLREETGRSPLQTLVNALQGRELLLVLDNCEHVLDGSAEIATQLLQAAPNVRILTTSREPLGVEGEWTWRVPSLNTAAGSTLFVERSRLVRPGFEPSEDERASIAQLVQQLDGLPLAIELAAARSRVMQPARLLESLSDRFRLLTGGGRQRMPRQQTLEASVSWSYDMLSTDEQQLAQRLSVMRDFDLDAAVAVNGSFEESNVVELLTRLVDKSLIVADHNGRESRYRFLETVRQFMVARLQRSDEMFEVRQRHLLHFLKMAERCAPDLASREGPRYLSDLQLNLHNLDSALDWAEATKATSQMLRMVVALSLFFELGGHLAHGGRWFARALALSDAAPEQPSVDAKGTPVSLRARALWGSAHAAFYAGQYEPAAINAEQALNMAGEVGDNWARGRALNTLGVLNSLSQPVQARDTLAQSVALGKANKDDWALGDGIKMTTVTYFTQHNDAGCVPVLEDLRRVGEALGSRFFLAWHQGIVGYFARDRGDLELAATAYASAAAHSHYVGDPSTGGFVECWASSLDMDTGRFESARTRLQHLLETAAAKGSELALPETLYAMTLLMTGSGDPAGALGFSEGQSEPLVDAGVPHWGAQLHIARAAAQRILGDTEAATASLDRALEIVTSLENDFLHALILYERGVLAHANREDPRAETHLHAALAIQTRDKLKPSALRTLEAIARIASAGESYIEATRIAGAADGLRKRIGLARSAIEQSAHDSLVTGLRASLGDSEFDAQWKTAIEISLAEIVEYATRMRGQRKRPSIGWDALTPTELKVAALVAEGLTNPEIGERMFIARGTAKIHVAHIFGKLGITSRSQLAALFTSRSV